MKKLLFVLIIVAFVGGITYLIIKSTKTPATAPAGGRGGQGGGQASDCSGDWLCTSMSLLGGVSGAFGNIVGGLGNMGGDGSGND